MRRSGPVTDKSSVDDDRRKGIAVGGARATPASGRLPLTSPKQGRETSVATKRALLFVEVSRRKSGGGLRHSIDDRKGSTNLATKV
jgi:hypothetical protein